MNEWTNEWMNEPMNEWINEPMNEWINEWMNEPMNEWINEWRYEFCGRRHRWSKIYFLVFVSLIVSFFCMCKCMCILYVHTHTNEQTQRRPCDNYLTMKILLLTTSLDIYFSIIFLSPGNHNTFRNVLNTSATSHPPSHASSLSNNSFPSFVNK